MNCFFPGRYWWLRGVQGAVATELGVCMLVLLISTLRGGGNIAAEIGILLAIFCVLCWGSSILYTLQALEARRWFRSRLQAMQGDQDVIPRAVISSDPNHAPELADGPLTVLWQSTPGWRHTWIGVCLFLYPFLASIAGLGGFVLYLLVSQSAFHQLPVEISVVVVQGVGIMIVGPLIGLIVLGQLPIKPNLCYGIVANSEGFFYYPQLGKTQFIRWEEIRLFEVVGTGDPQPHRYRLYGRKAIADWRDQSPPWGFDLPNMTREEFQERNQAVLHLIMAKTHLLPRTFDKRLAVSDEPLRSAQDQ